MSAEVVESTAVEEAICRAIRTVKPSLEEVTMGAATDLAELGLESLERAIVVFEIEDAYEISLIDANLDRFRTIGEARDIVVTLLAKKRA